MELTILPLIERGLTFNIRPNTTDEQAILECAKKQVYRKKGRLEIEPTDTWLDLGANVGGFAVHAANLGATVFAIEPEEDNFSILTSNVELNGLQDKVRCLKAACISGDAITMDLYVCNTEKNKYRHTLKPIRGRETVEIACVNFDSIFMAAAAEGRNINAVKMDIEGSEMEILDANNWHGIKKLAFEYHFDMDRSVANFRRRMALLEKHFPHVDYAKIPDDLKEYNFYPAMRIVHCYF